MSYVARTINVITHNISIIINRHIYPVQTSLFSCQTCYLSEMEIYLQALQSEQTTVLLGIRKIRHQNDKGIMTCLRHPVLLLRAISSLNLAIKLKTTIFRLEKLLSSANNTYLDFQYWFDQSRTEEDRYNIWQPQRIMNTVLITKYHLLFARIFRNIFLIKMVAWGHHTEP